jgi:hypothetical protein
MLNRFRHLQEDAMSYRLTFFSGFDQATESLSDDQINQVFDALTEMAQEEGVRAGNVKVARDLWVSLEVRDDELHVTGVSTRAPGAKPQRIESQRGEPQRGGPQQGGTLQD